METKENQWGTVPRHIAIIMDGNGRWAKERGKTRQEGHRAGVEAVRTAVELCVASGVKYLTLYSFSSENWNRQYSEVQALMSLFKKFLDSEIGDIIENGIRLNAIGNIQELPLVVRTALKRNIEASRGNSKLCLTLAVNYGGRSEIVHATKLIAKRLEKGEISINDLSEKFISQSLWTSDLPDPDLLIRTSGELRISNFLLWQIAYSEIVVVPENWPDFDEDIFRRCLEAFSRRERRFGCASEQVNTTQHKSIVERFGFPSR